jgi:PAS domain S-box-containing protein
MKAGNGNSPMDRLSYPLAFFFVVASYFAAAVVGSFLSLPPANASPIWPAAGVAVAALLLGGLRLWPAIVLGYVAFQLVPASSFSERVDTLTALINGAVLGLGAAAQAAAGAYAVSRQRGGLAPAGDRTVLRTMLLVGPIACLISASWAASFLLLRGIVPLDLFVSNWLVWWAGDTIGVLLFAPLAALALPAGRRLWRGRVLQTALPLVATAALVVPGIYWFNSSEESAAREPLSVQAGLAFENYNERLRAAANRVLATGNLFASSDSVSDSAFSLYANRALGDGLLALGWAPRVTHADRARVEDQARQGTYPDFRIRERNASGEFVRAGIRDTYFPVLYLESTTGTKRTLGLDISTEPRRLAAFMQACDSGQAVATAPLPLIGDGTPGVVLFTPVYSKGIDPAKLTIAERRAAFRGVVAGILDPAALFGAPADPDVSNVIGYSITDTTDGLTREAILDNTRAVSGEPDILWTRNVELHSRIWQQQAIVTGSYWQAGQSARSKVFLGAMLICVLLIAVQTLAAAATHRAVSLKVAARTRELANSRRKMLAALHGSHVGCWELDILNWQLLVDDTYLRLLGTDAGKEGGNRFRISEFIDRFAHPDDAAALGTIVETIGQGDIDQLQSPLEFRLVRRDGSTRHVEARFEYIYTADGRLARMIGSSQDITERKQTELALRKSEEYSRKILSSNHDCIKVMTLDGTILDITPNGVKLLDANSTDEVLGIDWPALWTNPEDIIARDAAFAAARSGIVGRFQGSAPTFKGVEKHWDNIITPMNDEDGNPERLLCVSRDITEEHVAKQEISRINADLEEEIDRRNAELAASERELRATFNVAAVGISHVDLDGNTLRANPRLCEIVGYTEAELADLRYTTLTHPGDASNQRTVLQKLIRGDRTTATMEKRYVRKDGTPVWVRESCSLVRDANGDASYLVIIAEDISVERNERETRIAGEKRFRATFEMAALGIAHIDRAGRFIAVNPRLCQVTGYSEDELLAIDSQQLDPPDELDVMRAQRERMWSGEISSFNVEKRFRCKDGTTIWTNVTVSPVHDANDEIDYAMAIVEDISWRKDAETELRRQQGLNRLLLETLSEGVVACDANGKLMMFNKVAREWHGCDLRSIPPEEWADYYSLFKGDGVTPLDKDDIPLMRAYRGERVHNVEMSIVRKGQPPRILLASGAPLIDSEGSSHGAVVVMHDITESRRNERRIRDLFELAPDAMIMTDADGRIQQVNKQTETLFGWHRDALLGKPLDKMLPAVDPANVHALDEQRMDANAGPARNSASTLIGLRNDGSELSVDINVGTLHWDDGDMYVVAVRDIGERLRAEQVVREALATLDASSDGAYIFDPQSLQFSYVNEGAMQQLGYSREELLGMTVEDVAPEFTNDDFREALQPLIKGERASLFLSTVERSRDGRHIPVDVNLQYVAPAGESARCIAIVRDVTEARRALEELERAAEELRIANATIEHERASLAQRVAVRTAELTEANSELARAKEIAEDASRAKSSFLAVMSHEIRTPMNGIVGMVDVLAQSALSANQADAVQTIQDSSFSLLRIIDDILDFSKIEAGKLQLETAAVALADLVESVCDSLTPAALSKNVDLHLFVDPALPAIVSADSTRLRQLLYNLVGNAIKFSSDCDDRNGEVQLRVEPGSNGPNDVVFRIIDNGIGIEPQLVPLLFSSFTQAEASTTRRFGGTGLGLAITQRLVELMGGSIKVESEQGAGSEFTVRLPLNAISPQPAKECFDLENLECVLIEEENVAIETLERYLQRAGAKVRRGRDIPPPRDSASPSGPPLVVVRHIRRALGTEREIRLSCSSSPGHSFLLVSGAQRQPAQIVSPNTVVLHGGALRRNDFLRAVAIAAGRKSPELQNQASDKLLRGQLIAPTVAQARAEGRLILVAEDDPVNQKVILRQLGILGYAGELAVNGKEALDMWRKNSYALLLTDLHMPEMDGYELLASIRESEAGKSHTPAIALTANALRGEAEHANAVGFDAFLTKPLLLSVLGETLRDWIPGPANYLLENAGKGSNTENKHVDMSVLATVIGDDPEILHEFYREYLAATRVLTAELHRASAARDTKRIANLAHRQKGSCRAIGAVRLGDLCAELEQAARAGSVRKSLRLIEQFELTAEKVNREIDEALQSSMSDSGSRSSAFLQSQASGNESSSDLDDKRGTA